VFNFKMMIMDLAVIRNDYKLKVLDESRVNHNPLQQFEIWLNEAIDIKANEPTAMVLATSTPTGIPSARIVLLKALSDEGFVFFTNYSSRKGKEMAVNQNVALLFHWRELERQVRIEGVGVKTSSRISDEYFQSRPFESRLSAVISNQSQVVPNREYLEKLWEGQQSKSIGSMIERPSDWGGYLVEPVQIEFWQGRQNRLHDRVLYSKKGADWVISRLAP
jgi:pyridoxamine 5'-phosphate oxidase